MFVLMDGKKDCVYSCLVLGCGVEGKLREEMITHAKEQHLRDFCGKITCALCNRLVDDRAMGHSHIAHFHYGLSAYERKSSTVPTSILKDADQYICTPCEYECAGIEALLGHYRDSHVEDSRKQRKGTMVRKPAYRCQIDGCARIFERAYLHKHVALHIARIALKKADQGE